MSAFVECQQAEFAAAAKDSPGQASARGRHRILDAVTTTIEREASTSALHGSTEDEQFFDRKQTRPHS